MPAPDPTHPVLIHFYRATVGHADVWRQRMDATTNWAAATTAGMITFAFSRPGAPHFVLLLALVFDVMFLLMESRRYQAYDRWRRQFHAMNRYLIAPALQGSTSLSEDGFEGIVRDLSRTVPFLSLSQAVGYRLRRNYGYLLGVVIFSWLLKLQVHPTPAHSFLGEAVGRAEVGLVGSELILGGVVLFVVGCLVLGLRAPTERMMDWAEIGSPWGRIRPWGRDGSSTGPAEGGDR